MKSYLDEILGPAGKPADADPQDEMKLISQELIEAVHARNVDDVEAALRAAFECLDAEPHVEGPHEGPGEGGDGDSY